MMAKEYIVLTVIGPDKRGTVAKITDLVVSHQASIEESRMARLGGEFAVIMLLSVPPDKKDGCCTALELLQEQGLTTFVKQTDLSRLEVFQGFIPYEISVWGADHTGIVHGIAEYLASERINVETMDTHVTKAPLTGAPLFSMHATVQVPPEITFPRLREKLEELGDTLGVDITVKIPEA